SDETVKNLAFSVVTAGLTAGSINPNGGIVAAAQNATADALVKAGVKGIVYSDDFIESSIGYLKYAAVDIAGAGISEQIGVTSGAFADSGLNTALGTASYAALGCAMGAATTGNCGSGALASTSGALAGKVGISNDIGGLIAASIIASTGGSVKEIYGANNVGNAANLGETIAQNITPAYYNPATGEVFNAYGQLLGTSATVVGDTLTGFSPVYASGWIDEYNGDSPAPNIWPGMGLTPSETGADFDVDTSTKDPIIPQFPASLVSNTKANPILIFLNQVMPTVRSDTQLHDPYIVKIGATDAGTKAVTIPSVFMYNTYGMFGTILDIPNYEQNTTNIAKDVIYGAPNATK
ncbi:MAG: putative hemagglutinin, partial [Rickettsiaceae bacterium]|nr:putative hemagglutinin [Rickettsiaceae bacterium]